MKKFTCIVLAVMIYQGLFAQISVTTKANTNSFPVVSTEAAAIYVDKGDGWFADKAAMLL